jgi:S-formylglutathione hydrolase FrmB
MPRPPTILRIESKVLRANPLGDGADRDAWVYTPPSHDPAKPLPALLALAGFTGNGAMFWNHDPLGDALTGRLDRLIDSGELPPCIVVAPDCFTRWGGNQYIDSPGTGAYATYLTSELVPAVERTCAVSAWGVFGKSSGGFGAIVLSMLHPQLFRACADHSGDSNFELCYLPDALETLDQVRAAGGVRAWHEAFWASRQRRTPRQIKALGFLAMAAHYSPNPDSDCGFDLPFCLETGRFRDDVWERWRAWDPVRMVPRHADALRSLSALFIDCGTRDEYGLHWGARALSRVLRDHGVPHLHEEFDDTHMNVSYRFERSIPFLVRALMSSR